MAGRTGNSITYDGESAEVRISVFGKHNYYTAFRKVSRRRQSRCLLRTRTRYFVQDAATIATDIAVEVTLEGSKIMMAAPKTETPQNSKTTKNESGKT